MERKITRREAVGAAGSVGVAYLLAASGLPVVLELLDAAPAAAASASSVVVTPSMTEGPYWIDEMLRRFDVRGNTSSASSRSGTLQAGVPLTLKINVLDSSGGRPINGAHVDIWHANAYGLYSDEGQQQTGGGTTNGNTQGQNFLRGYQVTGIDAGINASPVGGQVSFKTIWPGWYQGRAIHIHVRVRTYDASGAVATNYTTQIFFSDKDNSTVLTGAAPYRSRSPQSDPTTDENDNVLTKTADATNIVSVAGTVAGGFAATFNIGLNGVASNVSSGAASGTTVSASIRSATVVKAANGQRTLVVSLHAGEPLTAHASLFRAGKTLGKATGHIALGTHSLRVSVPGAVAGGAAIAKLALADAAGNSRTLTAPVTVPA
jgi:protocatechuate 3,4-dioxygenase beta subunit